MKPTQSEPGGTSSPIQDVSDTARWAAVYRARETERPDAVFRDPFARRLAGVRGEAIAAGMTFPEHHAWSWVTRTHLFDQLIAEQVKQGVDLVINLGAGLDARPYRMDLPASLKWVEVDLPGILRYKTDVLANERPACVLERVPMDLRGRSIRTELFQTLGEDHDRALIVAEGLLIYFSPTEVAELALDLAAQESFQRWLFDLASPVQRALLLRKIGGQLGQAGAVLKFAPEQGTDFFASYGWRAEQCRGLLKTAASLKRSPFLMRLLALLPEPQGPPGLRPWSGVCLMSRHRATTVAT